MRKIEQAAILNNLQEDDDESSDPISRRSSAISLTPSAANAVLSNGNTHGSSGSHEVDGDGAQRAGALSKGRVSLESSLHGLSEAPSHSSHPLPALPSLKQNTRSPDRVSKPTKKADARVRSPILAASKSAVSKTSRDGSSDYPALQSLLPTQHQPTYLNPAEPVPPALIDALLNLPPPNYYLLFATTAHLAHLLKYQSKNKMSLSNIMICIGPALKIENFILGWLLERWRDCWVGPAVPTGNVTADGAGNEGGSNGPRGEEEALRRENEWEEQRDGVLAEEEGDEVTDRVEAVTNGGRTMESPGPEARKEPGHHKLRRSTERLAQSKGR